MSNFGGMLDERVHTFVHHADREVGQVQDRKRVLDLLLIEMTAGHVVVLVQQFVRLVVRPPQVVLVNEVPDLSRVDEAGPLHVDGSADFVDATVSSWVEGEHLLLLVEHEVLQTE